ncbi:MAG: hypothetical protein ACK4I8_07060 [Armatimonadota bacterium]
MTVSNNRRLQVATLPPIHGTGDAGRGTRSGNSAGWQIGNWQLANW